MEKSEMEDWLNRFNIPISQAFRLSYPVRDKTLQEDAATSLESFLRELEVHRVASCTANDGDAANLFLGLCSYANSMIKVLRMWLALRADHANEAWDALVSAQHAARAAMRAHRLCAAQMTDYRNYLNSLEDILFPPQQFVSSSLIVKSSDCSLCKAPYHECGHIAGFPYNGQFCVEIIRQVAGIDHVALVDCPNDKRCRVTCFPDGGFDVDSFTLRRSLREGKKDE